MRVLMLESLIGLITLLFTLWIRVPWTSAYQRSAKEEKKGGERGGGGNAESDIPIQHHGIMRAIEEAWTGVWPLPSFWLSLRYRSAHGCIELLSQNTWSNPISESKFMLHDWSVHRSTDDHPIEG